MTKEFIKTNSTSMGTSYIFFRKNGKIQTSGGGVMKCEVFD